MKLPVVVTLCGSSRFKEEHERAQREETLLGKIVIPMGLYGHLDGLDMSGPVKRMLDELHLRKIDMADEILVINPRVLVCGKCGKPTRYFTVLSGESNCCRSKDVGKDIPYIGISTIREIVYALWAGKQIYFLESPWVPGQLLDDTAMQHFDSAIQELKFKRPTWAN
jgi:hypothetical protein